MDFLDHIWYTCVVVIYMCKKTCCFFGHRTINETEELKSKLTGILEKLIAEENVDTFLFGSKSGIRIALDYAVKKRKNVICVL